MAKLVESCRAAVSRSRAMLVRCELGVRMVLVVALGLAHGCAEQTKPAEGGYEQTQNESKIPVTALRLSDVLSGADDAGFDKAETVKTFVFPLDHGKHPTYRSEWWYLTATLKDETGQHYGVQFTIFRQAMAPQALGTSVWQSGQAYLAHFALTDVANNRHYADQRFARQHPADADVRLDPGFAAYVADWKLMAEQPEGGPVLQLDARGRDAPATWDGLGPVPEFAASLSIDFDTIPIPQGEAGLSKKGPGQASYYYSQPRMETTGWLEIGARRVAVTGSTWMDREWSTSVLADGVAGWDWLALRLADGRDIMAFRLRRRDGTRDPYDHGLVAKGGGATVLNREDFLLEPTRFWRDSEGVAWPVGWSLTLPQGERLSVDALVDDQLMELGLTYWEGIVSVKNQSGATLGQGYLELTGYRVMEEFN